MAVEGVKTAVTDTGQVYTQAISNDSLDNEDFLMLMLEQMKQQDPTKPQDSQNILNQQMQMSNIETNTQMANSMKSLQATFENNALSTASNVIGKIVETDEIGEDGYRRAYQVGAAEIRDGVVYVQANEVLPSEDGNLKISKEPTLIPYNKITKINYTATAVPTSGSSDKANDSTDTTTGDDTDSSTSDTTTNS